MFIKSAARAFAAATLLGSLVLAGPLTLAAPATTEPAVAAAKADPVEARIKELHNRLHITAAQQTQWDGLVQVMRDNAKAMTSLQKRRSQDAKAMTAVDAVKSYEAVIAAHEAGMAKFVPAFETLYDSMSATQKATADSMFRGKVSAGSAKKRT
jgi:LTXXQ motif family protein